jgi:hypothetical protein
MGDHSKKNGMGRACCTCGERRGAYRGLVWELEEKRPLGRPGHRRVDNIKDLQEIGWGGSVDWIDLA